MATNWNYRIRSATATNLGPTILLEQLCSIALAYLVHCYVCAEEEVGCEYISGRGMRALQCPSNPFRQYLAGLM